MWLVLKTGIRPQVKVFLKVFLLTVPSRSFVDRFMLHVGVCCADVSVPCSLVVTCWERAVLLAVLFVVLCHFPKCVLVHIIIFIFYWIFLNISFETIFLF